MVGLKKITVYNNSTLAGFSSLGWPFHAIQFFSANAFKQHDGGFVVFVLGDQLTAESLFRMD
jgi:hypothetical protein